MGQHLAALQRRFLGYVSSGDPAIVADIAGATGEGRQRRLSIYYSAYRARLRGSIETDHPVLARYLGDDLFDRMAAAYIDRHPSRFTSLRHFCDHLPAFLAEQEPFAGQPVLADIAAYERLLMDVFDAAETPRLDTDFAATVPTAEWPGLTLTFHPSVRLFETRFNSVEIWRALKAEKTPPAAAGDSQRTWLIWRNRERLSEFRSLAGDELQMFTAAQQRANFAALCDLLLALYDPEAVAPRAFEILTRWLRDGLLVQAWWAAGPHGSQKK